MERYSETNKTLPVTMLVISLEHAIEPAKSYVHQISHLAFCPDHAYRDHCMPKISAVWSDQLKKKYKKDFTSLVSNESVSKALQLCPYQIQNALGSLSIFMKCIDFIVWLSVTTEPPQLQVVKCSAHLSKISKSHRSQVAKIICAHCCFLCFRRRAWGNNSY